MVVAFALNAGMTTGLLILYGDGAFEVDFDFIEHNLIRTDTGTTVLRYPNARSLTSMATSTRSKAIDVHVTIDPAANRGA